VPTKLVLKTVPHPEIPQLLPVPLYVVVPGRDAREYGNELLRTYVIANQFTAPLCTNCENLCSIAAWNRTRIGQRPICELNRRVCVLQKPGSNLCYPKVRPALVAILKDNVPSVRRPLGAAYMPSQRIGPWRRQSRSVSPCSNSVTMYRRTAQREKSKRYWDDLRLLQPALPIRSGAIAHDRATSARAAP
jgi:hypothetical protein